MGKPTDIRTVGAALYFLPVQTRVALKFGVFWGKVVGFLFFYMWVRWTLPRFRFDQLTGLGWKILLPLGLANVALTAAWVIWGKS